MLGTTDPTAYDLGGNVDLSDPRVRRLDAWSNHGNMRLQMPFITEVTENLWHGGVQHGLVLPSFITHVVSLYSWERYEVRHDLAGSLTVRMYDSLEQSFEQVDMIAQLVNLWRAEGGTVLVHCQAGLNRSSLVVARALMLAGDVSTGQEAIDLIRARRDPACLCNPAFEAWVRDRV